MTAPGLALAGIALCVLYALPPGAPAAAALTLTAAGGAVHAYLAVRIEFDRRIFEAFTLRLATDAASLRTFDDALHSVGLRSADGVPRDFADRVRGLKVLVKSAACLLSVQLVLALAGCWVRT